MGRKNKYKGSSPVREDHPSSSSSSSGGAAAASTGPRTPSKKSTEGSDTSIFDERRKVKEEEQERSKERAAASDFLTKFPRLMKIDYRSCKTYVMEREAVLRAWKEAGVEMTDKQKVQSSHLASFDPELLRGICKYDENLRSITSVSNEDLEAWLSIQLKTVEEEEGLTDLRAFARRLKEYSGKAELYYGRRSFITLSPILRVTAGARVTWSLIAQSPEMRRKSN